MTLELLIRGLAIGFAVAFALGPIGLLVIRRTIERGWAVGFASGLGVATADATYGAIAAFGLTALTGLLVGVDRPLGIIGGAVLLVLAARALRGTMGTGSGRTGGAGSSPDGRGSLDPVIARVLPDRPGPARTGEVAGAWLTMVGLTLTNPATILSFTALFASIGPGTGGAAGATAVVAGVFGGSVGWWAILTALVKGLRARLTAGVVRWLNVISALLIAGFGVVAIGIGLTG
jgi:threonine/homoserine/homoserine lactone efflux protein